LEYGSDSRHRRLINLAAAAILVAAALLVVTTVGARELVLTDEDSGEVYLRLPLRDGDEFSVTYTHSVHLTPVTETYEVRDRDIYVVAARFYTFGAGMQTEYPEGVSWSYGEDGGIVLTGYNIYCKDLIYCVSKLYDHVLTYRGRDYSLGELCGRGSLVDFDIE